MTLRCRGQPLAFVRGRAAKRLRASRRGQPGGRGEPASVALAARVGRSARRCVPAAVVESARLRHQDGMGLGVLRRRGKRDRQHCAARGVRAPSASDRQRLEAEQAPRDEVWPALTASSRLPLWADKPPGGSTSSSVSTTSIAAHRRMTNARVRFLAEPRREPYGWVAVFLDLCGNRWTSSAPPDPAGGPRAGAVCRSPSATRSDQAAVGPVRVPRHLAREKPRHSSAAVGRSGSPASGSSRGRQQRAAVQRGVARPVGVERGP